MRWGARVELGRTPRLQYLPALRGAQRLVEPGELTIAYRRGEPCDYDLSLPVVWLSRGRTAASPVPRVQIVLLQALRVRQDQNMP